MATAPSMAKAPLLPSIKSEKENPIVNIASDQGPAFDDFSYTGKLTNVEAQRIMAVLQEIQKKIHLIGLFPDAADRKVASVLNGDGFNLLKARINTYHLTIK